MFLNFIIAYISGNHCLLTASIQVSLLYKAVSIYEFLPYLNNPIFFITDGSLYFFSPVSHGCLRNAGIPAG